MERRGKHRPEALTDRHMKGIGMLVVVFIKAAQNVMVLQQAVDQPETVQD